MLLRLTCLPDINRIVTNRDEAADHLRLIENGELIVQVGGHIVTDSEALASIRKLLEQSCRDRIVRCNKQLLDLGVDVLS